MDAATLIQNTVDKLSGSAPEITTHEDEEGYLVFTVKVAGRVKHVIGKEGRTIHALRTLARAIGQEDNHKVKIVVNEERQNG